MLPKLRLAIAQILNDIKAIRTDVNRLQIQPVPKDGVSPKLEDIVAEVLAQIPVPKDGVSPKLEDIATEVLAQIPVPKDGVSPDPDGVAFKVLAQIDKPKDGVSPKLEDIATEVLAQIDKPKDGVSPKLEDIVTEVLAQIPVPKAADPEPATRAVKGKDGASVTKVKLEKGNKLAVWLNGVRRVVGTIEVPKAALSFTPGEGGGGRGATRRLASLNDGSQITPTTKSFNFAKGLQATSDGKGAVTVSTKEDPVENLVYLDSESFVEQDPTGLPDDTIIQVVYGAPQVNEYVEIDAEGTYTFKKTGNYLVTFIANYGRDTSSGTSKLFFAAQASFGGSPFDWIGNSIVSQILNSNINIPYARTIPFDIPEGTPLPIVIKNYFWRDSTGDNSGGLKTETPTLAAAPNAPSARLIIAKR